MNGNMKGKLKLKRVKGKKLLIISSDGCDIEFINAAREMGLYIVCCDRYSNYDISPAKKMADEAWNIDYTLTDIVAERCRQVGIDGVIAGYGEDRVAAASRISMAIGKPFYATEKQIEFTRNKRLFKEMCKKCGVKTPREFCKKLPITEGEMKKIELPVIVKPSDNGGRKGVSVCYKYEELEEAIELAQRYSMNGEIIIEEYLIGQEISSVYTIKNGVPSLSCINDKYAAENQNGLTQLCNIVITPSKYYQRYIAEVDKGLKNLLNAIDAQNGVAYFQLMVCNNGIYAFEMGYRMNGNNDYKVIRKYNDIDYMKMTIHYSLCGDMGDQIEKDNPFFPEYCCTYVVHLKAGIIAKMEISKLLERWNVEDVSMMRNVGDVINDVGTNYHKSGMIRFTAKDYKEIKETIEFINENIEILDNHGENMLMYRFDANRL